VSFGLAFKAFHLMRRAFATKACAAAQLLIRIARNCSRRDVVLFWAILSRDFEGNPAAAPALVGIESQYNSAEMAVVRLSP
jgi:hypothetical protein